MIRQSHILLLALLAVTTTHLLAYPVPRFNTRTSTTTVTTTTTHKTHAATAVATAALTVLLTAPLPAFANTAAQVSLDKLPPTDVSIQIQDLPVIGKLLSGTYTKVPDEAAALLLKSTDNRPSIVIKSPEDKVKAIKDIASGGHLEFDVTGKIATHLDIDVAADQPGVAMIRVSSKLIPKLPFHNLASSAFASTTGGKESEWNVVTNLGSGESYYFNMKTGVTQMARPEVK